MWLHTLAGAHVPACMCMQEVLREVPDVRLGYGESDEYSFVLAKSTNMYGACGAGWQAWTQPEAHMRVRTCAAHGSTRAVCVCVCGGGGRRAAMHARHDG